MVRRASEHDMSRNALNPTFVRTVQPTASPRLYGDGHGLYLYVSPTVRAPAKRWIQRLTVFGTVRQLSLGTLAELSLREARQIALENRRIARAGGEPRAHASSQPPAFAAALDTVIALHRPVWRHPERMAAEWRASLHRHAFPTLGQKSVATITTADVLAVLAPIWTAKPKTARAVRRRIGVVMRWAIVQGHRLDDPTATVTAALPRSLPRPVPHRALPYTEVAGAIARVHASGSAPALKLGFEFQVLCAARPGEARRARWQHIDLDAATWTIPASDVKTGRTHRVPLSDRALAVLHEARSGRRKRWVFPSPVTGGPFHHGHLRKVFATLGIDALPHGFRSSFRDWAAECTDAPHAVMEAALAHVVRNRVEAAYARTDLFERRSVLMQQWADYLNPPAAGSE
ncbi:MAG: tyrosine-type recombinase/integrase [Gammaproteobacteria bacterium]|nr:tyrosine-type recombinase/integrase [Gammaproteobacteria bacterium]